jgi:xanthine dehydrogenase YagS FAD-binding subunit
MRSFKHVRARTADEACALLEKHKEKAVLQAGGTDLLSILKGEILLDYPRVVIDIKTISGLDYIREEDGTLRIGALTKLSDIARSPVVMENWRGLAEASRIVATPQIRNAATLGGNLCQDVRCWYYRYPRSIGGPIRCLRKGAGSCPAVKGDNRYHAIMEGERCFAVCPSDTAVALAALNGEIRVAGSRGERGVPISDFFSSLGKSLRRDEMVTEIRVPPNSGSAKQRFLKFTLRRPIDFAIVSVASIMTIENGVCADARISLGAVAPGPIRAREAEERLKGKSLSEEGAAEAAGQALSGAKPLSMNAYKIEIAKTLVKRAILE